MQATNTITKSVLKAQRLNTRNLLSVGSSNAVPSDNSLHASSLRNTVGLDHIEPGSAADLTITQTSSGTRSVSADETIILQQHTVNLRRNNHKAALIRRVGLSQRSAQI